MAINIKKKLQNAKVYFVAAASVSKPVALLMLFFGLSFIASVLVGLFLLGQWGYNRVVSVDQPVAVTTEPSDSAPQKEPNRVDDNGKSDTTQPSPTTPSSTPEAPSANNTTLSKSTTTASTPLPDTGTSPFVYPLIALFGALFHSGYVRLKK